MTTNEKSLCREKIADEAYYKSLADHNARTIERMEFKILELKQSVRELEEINGKKVSIIISQETIISWYENMTGIMRDEIETIKIEGTDWEAYREGKNDKR